MDILTNKHRPIIFIAVGILNTLVDFLFYIFLVSVFFPKNEDIWIVGVISGTLALVCAYLTHRFITWRDRPVTKLTAIKFIGATGLGLWAIRPFLLAWFITWTPLYKIMHEVISPFIPISYTLIESTGAFCLMVVVIMTFNYLVYSRFVFRKM